MLGAYTFPGTTALAATDDPRMARLRQAWPAWQIAGDGADAVAVAEGLPSSGLGEAITCADGLRWRPPQPLPSLRAMERLDIDGQVVEVALRRAGVVRLPLGVGPVYPIGPRRGQPSSDYGRLLWSVLDRCSDRDHQWTAEDDRDAERLIFLAFAQTHHVTQELFDELAPYDDDEAALILRAINGLDPKPLPDAGATSQPPAPGPSSIPN